MRFSAYLALPGVVIHELGHYLLCRLCRVSVKEVVFFEPSGPSGYVVHVVPRRLRQHLIIVCGPLLLNTGLAFLLFRSAAAAVPEAAANLGAGSPLLTIQLVVAVVVGWSIGLQAIPSRADAISLWDVALDRLRAGNLLALFAVPLAGAILFVNTLRRFWFDWLLVAGLAGVAVWLPLQK